MAKVRVRKRNKTYSFAFEAGLNENGKRKVVEKGGYETEDEAYKAGVKAYTDWQHGNVGITSERITFNELFDVYVKNELSRHSEHYQNTIQLAVNKHIIPEIGNIVVQDIKAINIDMLLKKLAKKNVGRATLIKTRTTLSSIIDYAVYPCEILSYNVVKKIKPPKSHGGRTVERKVISREFFNEMIENIYPAYSPMFLFCYIAFYTGLRRGEITGLIWDNVDIEKGVLHISHQIRFGRSKQEFTSTLKTPASYREVLIPSVLLDVLRNWKLKQAEYKALYKDKYVVNFMQDGILKSSTISELPATAKVIDFVCTNNMGKIHTINYYSMNLAKIGTNPHSFRHTHCTELIEAGASPKAVASRLGHSIDMVMKLYSHNTEKMQADTLALFENAGKSKLQTNSRQYDF